MNFLKIRMTEQTMPQILKQIETNQPKSKSGCHYNCMNKNHSK